MSNTSTQPQKFAGRPPKEINWPTGSFTLNDIKSSLTRVALQLRAQAAVTNKILQVVGKVKSSSNRGRPSTQYSLITTSVTQDSEPLVHARRDTDNGVVVALK